ncbi:MAG: nitronate monooxygenase [Hydrogenophaga sp.]|uniref:nitronate monooxygenase n=1 Tax=Hydrogenophaga sp. TaxID=1904254 RepID=UPI002ABC190C|nr:nitronate monooxygenase [Hydrogenophaga sp.]MDZ4187354.1 nitronate monooxygenase [Hydrogenophaga sp.]
MPDFVVVEGPMAGGHLGFGQDWMKYDLRTIFFEIKAWLDEMKIKIPLIPAGGIFTNQDAKLFMDNGAAAIQVATRFTVAKECGLPEKAKIAYLESEPEDIVVNTISPTGYPMRMLKQSPGIGKAIKPNCEAYGYLLDSKKKCSYIDSYRHVMENSVGLTKVEDKTCLCTHMRNYSIWTCGSNVWRLKSVVKKLPSGKYELPTAQSIIADYLK